MAKLEQRTETVEEQEIELSPRVRRELTEKFIAYAGLQQRIKELELQKEEMKAEIAVIRENAGVITLGLNGFRTTLVGGTRKKLNKKKLIALGCAAAWIEMATEETPTKEYEKITLPGEKEPQEEA
jgi:hypothetical protein